MHGQAMHQRAKGKTPTTHAVLAPLSNNEELVCLLQKAEVALEETQQGGVMATLETIV